jgi:hypothetical protein
MRQIDRWLVAMALLPAGVAAAERSTSLHGFAFDEPATGASPLLEARASLKLAGGGLAVLARVQLAKATLDDAELGAVAARLADYSASGVGVVLDLGALPTEAELQAPSGGSAGQPAAGPAPSIQAPPDSEKPWAAALQRLAERGRGKVWAYELGGVPRGSTLPEPRGYAYRLKVAAVKLRAVDPEAKIVVGPLAAPDAAWLQAVYAEDTAPYIDAIAVEGDSGAAVDDVLARSDPDALLIRSGVVLPDDPQAASEALVEQLLAGAGRLGLVSFRAAPPVLPAALRAGAKVADILAGQVVALDPGSVHLSLRIDGADAVATLPHALLYNLTTLSPFLAYWGGPATGSLEVEMDDAAGKRPMSRDPLTGRYTQVAEFHWDQATKVSHLRVAATPAVSILDFNVGATESFASRVEVTGQALPSVAEIISRHQQAQAAQDAVVQSYTAAVHMQQHFRPASTDPGFDVLTDNRFYFDRESGSEWEELSFTLNGSRWGAKRPPFPLLQAEKVLSLPLDLRLNRDYVYRLDGVETLGGRKCYVVRFDPQDSSLPLYRGTVWIDAESYLKIKVHAVQTNLQAPVVASEEIQDFGPVAELEGRKIQLFDHFTNRQTILIAGRNLLVEREVSFSEFEVNPADFVARRSASRSSDHVMYRDTDQGLRYFVKRSGERVVQDKQTTRATAAAAGVTYDPTYDYPLPIIGINHLDFEFLGKKRQLALLFGGILALANVQQPGVFGKKTDLSVDMFAIAIRGNDEVFDAEGERRDERLRNLPFNLASTFGYQINAFHKLTARYEFRYDNWAADDQTDPSFRLPTNTVTNGGGLGYEFKRWGYSLQASSFFYHRGSWQSWGYGDEYHPSDQSYRHDSVSLAKDFFWAGGTQKIHANLAYFGGAHLDRFSAYQSGMFDENRLHGVPAAGVRFVEQAILRGAYTFNILDLYRLDLFVDQALGKPPNGTSFENVTGLGLGFNLRGPWNTLVRAEVGKSFLPEQYRGAGSFVGQILFLKPL